MSSVRDEPCMRFLPGDRNIHLQYRTCNDESDKGNKLWLGTSNEDLRYACNERRLDAESDTRIFVKTCFKHISKRSRCAAARGYF